MLTQAGELLYRRGKALVEEAGAALLDFTNSGPVAGPAVTAACGIV